MTVFATEVTAATTGGESWVGENGWEDGRRLGLTVFTLNEGEEVRRKVIAVDKHV